MNTNEWGCYFNILKMFLFGIFGPFYGKLGPNTNDIDIDIDIDIVRYSNLGQWQIDPKLLKYLS